MNELHGMTNECCLCGKEYTMAYTLFDYGINKDVCRICRDKIDKQYKTYNTNYTQARIKQDDDKTKCYFCLSESKTHICYDYRDGVFHELYLCKKCINKYANNRKKFVKTMCEYLTMLYAFDQEWARIDYCCV